MRKLIIEMKMWPKDNDKKSLSHPIHVYREDARRYATRENGEKYVKPQPQELNYLWSNEREKFIQIQNWKYIIII